MNTKSNFSKAEQEVWDRTKRIDKLNDVFVENEFRSRNLKLQDIKEVELYFTATGTVFVSDERSTESHSPKIAIMKSLIRTDIIQKYETKTNK